MVLASTHDMVRHPVVLTPRAPGRTALWALAASVLSGSAAVCLVLVRLPGPAGALTALSGAFLVLAGVRARNDADPRARLAELVCDRLIHAVLLASIAWANRSDAPSVAVLSLIALGADFLAGYERARGESLGYRGNEGLAFRAARFALVSLALLTRWTWAAMWAFLSLTLVAAGVRAWNVVRQDRRS